MMGCGGHTLARCAAIGGVIGLLHASAIAAPACDQKLGPASKRVALLARLDETYQFLVRGTQPALAAAKALANDEEPDAPGRSLDSFELAAVSLRVRDATTLCGVAGIDQVWYLHPDLAQPYLTVLRGLHYVYRTVDPPNVVNMSVGPPAESYPLELDAAEPMHHATRKLVQKGLQPVVAIGNFYSEATPGMVNPWCFPDWVVCVGAASADGRKLWSQSSRGLPGVPTTWPTVVAHGVDVLGPWPATLPKSDRQRAYDEAHPDFLSRVQADRRHEFTLMSGSSQATAQVSRAAAQIIFFVKSLAEKEKKEGGDRLFSLSIPRERFQLLARLGKRLTGSVVKEDAETVEVEYRLVEPWRLVKQLLMDTAIPMDGYKGNEVGAGFVHPSYVEEQFGTFGIASKRLLPVKVD